MTIQNHTKNIRSCYCLETKHFTIDFFELLELAEDNGAFETVEEFLGNIRKLKYFSEYPHKAAFNPFKPVLTGKITIKVKGSRINKAAIKKLLYHEDTKVICDGYYTDDYLSDSCQNFRKNTILENSEVLRNLDNYSCFESSDHQIVLMNSWSNYHIVNKSLVIERQ